MHFELKNAPLTTVCHLELVRLSKTLVLWERRVTGDKQFGGGGGGRRRPHGFLTVGQSAIWQCVGMRRRLATKLKLEPFRFNKQTDDINFIDKLITVHYGLQHWYLQWTMSVSGNQRTSTNANSSVAIDACLCILQMISLQRLIDAVEWTRRVWANASRAISIVKEALYNVTFIRRFMRLVQWRALSTWLPRP